jgi:DNA-binding MarR family transcriptional regulator
LKKETIMPTTPKDTARAVIETVPLIMRTVRAEMRSASTSNLSVPQFRTLGFIARHPQTSLSDVAEHIGLALPSMSKLVDGLVERKLVMRQNFSDDRRRIMLELTTRGQELLQSAHASTQAAFAERLSTLSESDRATVACAMQILHPLFSRRQADESPK